MAQLSVIPERMPVRFEHVDTEIWAAEALCMLQNRDWATRAYHLVGLDEQKMWEHIKAFIYVMKLQGVPIFLPKRDSIRQRISNAGLKAMDNVSIMNGYHPNTFFELMEGSFAVPMGNRLEEIEQAYDAGTPIWICTANIRG